ncbi:MAG: hypothetical protein ACYSSO_12560, partial [Planctomycetota bacterium]
MYKQVNYILLVLAVLVFTVCTAEAQYTSHNDQHGINCVDCHFAHNGSLVSRGAEQEILCKTCHNPTDMPSNPALYNVTNHEVDGGATIVDCGSCHEIHNPGSTDTQSALNLSRVRGNTAKYIIGALEPAIFESRPTDFAYDTANPPYNGICQSCHSSISRHTNDAWDESTNSAADNSHGMVGGVAGDCISCHPHEDAFAGSGGGCTDCHGSVKGSRRAVTGEFSLTSHHILAGSVTDADCEVCHAEVYGTSNHGTGGTGLIDLRNPVDGTALTGFTQFTSSEYTYVQDNFCLKCHDGNGAEYLTSPANPLRPFSSDIGYDVPNVFDALSTSNIFYHPVRGAGSNTFCNATTMEPGMDGAILTCFDCHTANGHGSSNQRALIDPIDFATMESTTDIANLPVGMGATVNTFCLRCHSSLIYVDGDNGSKFE